MFHVTWKLTVERRQSGRALDRYALLRRALIFMPHQARSPFFYFTIKHTSPLQLTSCVEALPSVGATLVDSDRGRLRPSQAAQQSTVWVT